MHYSPLRYPGGKSKLTPFMELLIKELNIKNGTYIEPFAGGAGIALELLHKNVVNKIIINDYDKAIASFWKSVVYENERFIEKMYTTPVTIEEWHRQKEILKRANKYSFELGFATFFLNRTNRSGIINGGPIGGYKQDGKWKIDVRFNKEKLAKRIYTIGKMKNNIIIYNKDFKSFMRYYLPKYIDNAFIYFDPPYFKKGKELYMNYFTEQDHKEIECIVRNNMKCKWIITYDVEPEILKLYSNYVIKRFDLNYSVAKKRIASELMIFPHYMNCPNNEMLKQNNIHINFR